MATLATSSRPKRNRSTGVKTETPATASRSGTGPGSRVVQGSLLALVLMSAGPPLSLAGNLRPGDVATLVPFTGPPFHEVVLGKVAGFRKIPACGGRAACRGSRRPT